jgi:pimeloyl-ACP methyl ester carboxylesterase
MVAPLTSVRQMAHRISPGAVLLFWTGLARIHYDTEAIVRSLDAPVWVAHGSRDTVVPVEMGQRVFAAAKVPGELLVLDTASHNDMVEQGGERYWRWLGRSLGAGPVPD